MNHQNQFILSNNFGRHLTKESFQALLTLLQWTISTFKASVAEVDDAPANQAALMDLQRLVFICKASLRLLVSYRRYYPSPTGNADKEIPNVSMKPVAVWTTIPSQRLWNLGLKIWRRFKQASHNSLSSYQWSPANERVSYSKDLVNKTCRLIACESSKLSNLKEGPNAGLASIANRVSIITPNRFTRTINSRTWNTGNGSPDAICFL